MKAVDEIRVPENTFIIAHANAIPPFDDAETTADYPNVAPTTAGTNPDVETTTTATQSFQIDFSEIKPGTSAEDLAKRTAQQQQNALPEWHLRSTVSGELTHAGSRQTEVQPEYLSFSRAVEEQEEKKPSVGQALDAGTQDEIAAYYAAARANAQQEIAQFEAEEAEFTDEDEGNWEDSNIGGTGVSSAISTPARSAQEPGETTVNGVTEPVKQAADDDDDDDDDDEDEEFEDV
jgi:transcription initiation factor TFIIE subunit alpha